MTNTAVEVSSGGTLIANSFDLAFGGLNWDASRLIVNGGTLRVNGSGTFSRGFSIGASGATIDVAAGVALNVVPTAISSIDGGTLTLAGAGSGQLQNSLGGNGQLVKTGTGSWRLTSPNSYSGITVVQQGLLTVNGTTGTGDVTVQPAGSLNGSGNVLGNLTVDGSVHRRVDWLSRRGWQLCPACQRNAYGRTPRNRHRCFRRNQCSRLSIL